MGEPGKIQYWLRHKAKGDAAWHVLYGILLVLGGIVLMVVVYGLIYLFVVVFLERGVARPVIGDVALWVIVLSFIVGYATEPDHHSKHSFTVGTKVVTFRVPSIGLVAGINPFTSGSRMFTEGFCLGQRLISLAMRMFGSAYRLMRIDVEGCSAVIAILLFREGRVSFEELVKKLGRMDAVAVFRQLGDVDGVRFLASAPPGLSLSGDLRERLSEAISGSRLIS